MNVSAPKGPERDGTSTEPSPATKLNIVTQISGKPLKVLAELRVYFSNPEALIEALEEMEEVLTGSAGSKNDGPIKQALGPNPN